MGRKSWKSWGLGLLQADFVGTMMTVVDECRRSQTSIAGPWGGATYEGGQPHDQTFHLSTLLPAGTRTTAAVVFSGEQQHAWGIRLRCTRPAGDTRGLTREASDQHPGRSPCGWTHLPP